MMLKGIITFYEERNFQGRSYECMSDCADMSSYLSRCQSYRVESGCFMGYERNNYMGQQYFMRRGEYPDMQHMRSMGMTFDNFRSCRMIPYITFYEERNFQGRSYECMSDCSDMSSYLSRCQSYRVESGCFMGYERNNYMGQQYFMRRGEYPDMQHMRSMGMTFDNFRSCRMIPYITFYEDRNFQGRSYECMSDCADMSSYLSRCHSCRVESGCFMVYDRNNYMGQQYFMRRGQYNDMQRMMSMGMFDNIRSCRMIPYITFYEDRNFQGRSYECMSDCSDMSSYLSRCQSYRVESGCFMGYERNNYMGQQYFMRRGEYPDMQHMRSMGMTFDNFRSCRMIPYITFYEERNFQGRSYESMSDCADMSSYLSRCQSCRVESGCFMVYERNNYMGQQYFMRRGEYPDMQRMMSMGMTFDNIRSCRMIPYITFYEERNFQGRSYECMSDCSDMSSYLSRCQSYRVESGCFMGYERNNYMGQQYFMRRGEYPDMQHMRSMGMTFDNFRSCRMIPYITFYEDRNFQGRSYECMSDCSDMSSYLSRCQSYRVESGCFMGYERNNYMGQQFFMRRGEYPDMQHMRSMGMTFDNFRSCRMIPYIGVSWMVIGHISWGRRLN
ncbi:hypothetical protein CRUP_011778 [Coryphaenoides rupestris]|nr:hypothetical protein CRUP_011778 [Coryphaenoides rupestris]